MSPKLCWIILCVMMTSTVLSQKKDEPSASDIEQAKELKKLFPEDDLALELSQKNIHFSLNEKQGKVVVHETNNKSFINLGPRANTQEYCFYDGQSEIGKFHIKSKNNKKTYNYKLRDEAFTSEDLFHNDTRVKYYNLNFPLLGYKLKSEINKEYHNIKYFTAIYLNENYPTVRKTVKVEVPNWLELELKEFNFEGYSIQKNVYNNGENNSKVFTYTIENIAGISKEKQSPGPSHIYPHLLILAKSYTKEGEKHVLFNSTQDQYNWYQTLTNSLKNDNSSFTDKVKSLTKNAETDYEKIKNIYYWVQDNIRYIAFEDGIAGFKPEEASSVYHKRYGDCKGMANLMKQMLIEAGFDARLTWIGTNYIAYDYSTPNLAVDNHMICSLVMEDAIYFLDGTESFNSFGEYAHRIQGKEALIENGDNYILKTVPQSNPQFNKEQYKYQLKLLEDGIIYGTGYKEFNGESRAWLLHLFSTLKTDKKDNFLEYYLNNNNKNITVYNIETSNLEERDGTLKITYETEIKNAATSFDNEIYVDIDFDKELNNFTLEDRTTNYIFNFKRFLETTTILEIPEHYNIKHIPENISIKNKDFDLSVSFSVSKNFIKYSKSFQIKNAQIKVSDFEIWNEFISKLKTLYNEQIIFTKL